LFNDYLAINIRPYSIALHYTMSHGVALCTGTTSLQLCRLYGSVYPVILFPPNIQ